MPVLDERHGLRRDALVVPAERARARRGAVASATIVTSSEPYLNPSSTLSGREEARPGVRRLRPEDPVELRWVAARLVDLHVQLGGVEDDRPRARTGTAARDSSSTASSASRSALLDEVEAADVLVAGGLEAPAAVGVAPPLVLVAVDRVRLDAGPDRVMTCSVKLPSVAANVFHSRWRRRSTR